MGIVCIFVSLRDTSFLLAQIDDHADLTSRAPLPGSFLSCKSCLILFFFVTFAIFCSNPFPDKFLFPVNGFFW